MTAHDFFEGGIVTFARLTNQLQVRNVFDCAIQICPRVDLTAVGSQRWKPIPACPTV
jgi:hypothetical protein